jgi:molybdate transport system substrate-binding protein
MRHPFPLLVAAAALAGGPGCPAGAAAPRAVTVAVAANLKPAFEELAARFRAANPGVDVRATYGASGTLFAQIANGAPFDLFLSADAEFPARVVEQGLADGPAFTYAFGRLVVWVPRDSTLDLEGKGLAALADRAAGKIALANPEVAPYGRAARAALERAGLWAALRDRIVLGQNVAQAAQFAQSGNAQAAFLPLSLARTAALSVEGRAWPLPGADRIEQAGVVTMSARDPALARALAAFVAGAGARDVLERHGYDVPAR